MVLQKYHISLPEHHPVPEEIAGFATLPDRVDLVLQHRQQQQQL
jgi:hypothetical protein